MKDIDMDLYLIMRKIQNNKNGEKFGKLLKSIEIESPDKILHC